MNTFPAPSERGVKPAVASVDDWVTEIRSHGTAAPQRARNWKAVPIGMVVAGVLGASGLLAVFHQVAEEAVQTASLRRVQMEEQSRALVRCSVLPQDGDRQTCKTQVLAALDPGALGQISNSSASALSTTAVDSDRPNLERVPARNDVLALEAGPVSVRSGAVKVVAGFVR